MARRPVFKIGKTAIKRGDTRDVRLPVSQRYTSDPITLPLRVMRAAKSGPIVLVCAGIHGDEINGLGIIHEIMFGRPLDLIAGTVVLIPAINIFGVETGTRYMPDRRDLNRCFPGSVEGSLAGRYARLLFDEVLSKCDYCVDLHSAAAPRTNYPNIRANLRDPRVRQIAKAFGCELMINGTGPKGSLRREATLAGCATITLEAGEPGKVEPSILAIGLRGVMNVLKSLGMLAGEPTRPGHQIRVERATWVRASVGGILRFHVSPGEPVRANQPIATNASIFGEEQTALVSPVDGVVLGMTTLPLVKPGEPVCHIAVSKRSRRAAMSMTATNPEEKLHLQVREDLAKNISVSEHEGEIVSDDVDELD